MSEKRAIIDIGSNTVRLVVYDGSPRAPSVFLNEKVTAKLGKDVARNGLLSERAMAVALSALARYATLLYGQLDPNGTLKFCNAGHNPPLIYGADGLRRVESGGMPVGMFEFAPYSGDECTLKAGDTLVIYSDGVTEAHNVAGEEFGEARLVEVLERYSRGSAEIVLEQIVNAVKEFAHGAEQYDDVTVLVVKYTGPK